MKTLITTVAALVLVAGCTGTQPPPPCLAAHGSFAVEYTKTAGTSAGACALTNSIVGVQKYNQEDSADLPKLAIRPIEIGWNDDAPETIAIGTFQAGTPDAQSFCHVPTFASDSVSGTLTFKFSNVELYVNAKAPGTQMSFDVQVTDTAVPCDATYQARAVWPVVSCAYLGGGILPEDKNCALVDGTLTDFWSYWSGLALNPDFDVKCVDDPNDWVGQYNGDSIGAFCVPDKDIPSFCVTATDCTWRPKE